MIWKIQHFFVLHFFLSNVFFNACIKSTSSFTYDFIYQKRFKIVNTKKHQSFTQKKTFLLCRQPCSFVFPKAGENYWTFLGSFVVSYWLRYETFFLQIKVLEAESNGNTCILSIQHSDHVFSSWRTEQNKMLKYAPIPITYLYSFPCDESVTFSDCSFNPNNKNDTLFTTENW